MAAAAPVIMGLPSLLINCVACFEIVQYGRTLETDRDTFVLRLHYIGVILSRWGASRGIIGTINPELIDPQLEECRPILERIVSRFNDAQRKSEKFRLKAKNQEQLSQGATNLQLEEHEASGSSNFRKATSKLMHKYATKYDNAATRTKWAIYERKVLENLVSNLRSDVDDLVELFPDRVTRPTSELIVEEVQEFEDAVLPTVQRVSHEEEDTTMEEAATAEIEKRKEEGHTFDEFDIEGQDGLQFQAGDNVGFGAARSGAGSAYRNFRVRGSGKVHTGDEYHGQVPQ